MKGGRKACLGTAGALAAIAAATPAGAAPFKFQFQAESKLGYDTNAFLSTGHDLATGYFEAVVTPKLSQTTEQGVVEMSGYFDATKYFQHYGNSNQYGGSGQFQRRVSPKLSIHGALRYDSEVIGQGRADENVVGPPIDNIDVNLIGLRRRSYTIQANAGWEYQLSPKDSISADGGYTGIRYKDGGGDASKNYGGSVGWKHAISERSKIGIRGSAYYIDYDTPHMHTLVMEPDVTFSTELSSTWHFDVALGVTFSKVYLPLPQPDFKSHGLSGSLNLCHKAVKDDFCLYAARSVTASGAGGTVERSQVGADYRRRLTEHLSWSGTVDYTRSKSQSGLLGTRDYVSAHGGFEWIARRWLTLGVEGRYRDVFGGSQIRGDYGGEANATLFLPARR
jgi:hypothetical protein